MLNRRAGSIGRIDVHDDTVAGIGDGGAGRGSRTTGPGGPSGAHANPHASDIDRAWPGCRRMHFLPLFMERCAISARRLLRCRHRASAHRNMATGLGHRHD